MSIPWADGPMYKALVDRAVKELAPGVEAKDFGWLVASGLSGCVIGTAVGAELSIPCAIVRKPEDSRHGHSFLHNVEGPGCFFDDFITYGSTFIRCHEAVGYEQTQWEKYRKQYQQQYPDMSLDQLITAYLGKPPEEKKWIEWIYTYNGSNGARGSDFNTAPGSYHLYRVSASMKQDVCCLAHSKTKPAMKTLTSAPRDVYGRFAKSAG